MRMTGSCDGRSLVGWILVGLKEETDSSLTVLAVVDTRNSDFVLIAVESHWLALG